MQMYKIKTVFQIQQTHIRIKKTTTSYEVVVLNFRVPDGTRTHDIQNHNLTL